ncbi:hypothetical protein ACWEN6_00165 [Sphaerisporangium sp. NPDC004334]
MTTATAGARPASPLRRGLAVLAAHWDDAPAAERVCHVVGVVLVAAGVFHLGVFAVLGGPWEGPVSWRKPATFGVSFGLTLITIAWVTSYVRLRPHLRAVLLGVFAADCAAEVGGITLQAWRHVPSHFNRETTVDGLVSTMLAAGGVILVAVLVVFSVQALRGDPGLPASMRLALRAGFLTLLVGLASGAAMIARGMTLVAAGRPELAYQVGGFLKPVHGVSLHGVLVLPALAWLLGRTRWDEPRRTRVVALAAAGYGFAIGGALLLSLAR